MLKQQFQGTRRESQLCLTCVVLAILSVTPAVLSYTFIISIPDKDNTSFYGFYKQDWNFSDCWWSNSVFFIVITEQYRNTALTKVQKLTSNNCCSPYVIKVAGLMKKLIRLPIGISHVFKITYWLIQVYNTTKVTI